MKYRKKPIVIEAVKWTGDNLDEIMQLSNGAQLPDISSNLSTGRNFIKTLEGDMMFAKGDYIIEGVKGEFYPCKPDIFEASYDLEENQ